MLEKDRNKAVDLLYFGILKLENFHKMEWISMIFEWFTRIK